MSDPLPCRSCQAPATVHLTQIMDGKVIKVHLCEACAAQGGAADAPIFHLAELLAAQKHAADPAESGLVCPECGQTEAAFAKHTRFGCVTCYTVFSEKLAALLPRIQPAVEHTGKHPATSRHHAVRAELRRTREALAAAVKAEAYEDAGRLRDRIRELEAESGTTER